MMKYAFYATTYQSGGEGQINTQTDTVTKQTYSSYKTGSQTYGNRDHASNRIGI